MSVLETVLIYGVVPLVIVLLFAAVTLFPGRSKDRTKYRPGQSWDYAPLWYEPHPDVPGVVGGHAEDAPGAGHAAPRLGATASVLAIGQRPYVPEADTVRRTAAGGARGTW
ncbi:MULTISPECIES: aa3-type cytochrome oxidase subunit CtaJ [unclassified Modestobacter]|uniref:aa3-type cytochrome oxidase subunit CtaJ n=1 Tax=unclassified Modestobacter TaxID=2643866 RepID=UPI0022AA693A|nr:MULTISPECIES: hypothetical protein [unclassified Modestobacter]MCZ2824492.1 hypothetical protein [Modestobacter sp. VKM Ac-2981]MCZ2853980.1 hypothetical protein [Modestobacter sp. VKM Ac-2982]